MSPSAGYSLLTRCSCPRVASFPTADGVAGQKYPAPAGQLAEQPLQGQLAALSSLGALLHRSVPTLRLLQWLQATQRVPVHCLPCPVPLLLLRGASVRSCRSVPARLSNAACRPLAPQRPSSTAAAAGVAGGTASGKSTVCDLISQRLQEQSVVMLAQDSFYRNLTPEELDNVKGEASTCHTIAPFLRP